MKIKRNHLAAAFIILTAMVLPACGGGNSGGTDMPKTNQESNNNGSDNTAAAGTLAGTAATGAPIVGQVVAIDSSTPRKTFTAKTSATGAYIVNVPNGTAPFILTVVGTSGGKTVTLNSVATASGQTVNITPLTDLIVATAAGQPSGAALADLCASTVTADQTKCASALTSATSGTNLADAVTAVKQMIAPLDSTGADPLNGAFTANGSGMDAVLDKILVRPALSQGEMATVTLISVPDVEIGRVTLPATAGGPAVSATVNASTTDLTAATIAQTALEEIRACMASLTALYPANMTVAPTADQVGPFFDETFHINGEADRAGWLTYFTTLPSATAGDNGGIAVPGLSFNVSGFSPFDFAIQTSGTLLTTTPAYSLSTHSAWVGLHLGGTGNGGFNNWRLIKGNAYAGCAGGWKLGNNSKPFDMHMGARISKRTEANSNTTYRRSLPFHVPNRGADTNAIGKIVVTGPGLAIYSGNKATPVGAATPITLITAPIPSTGTRPNSMGIKEPNTPGYYASGHSDGEEIQSCQDIAAVTAVTAKAGTPCYDEKAVAPGAVYTYTAFGVDNALKFAFPYQINAVPLSRAFVLANQADLFPQDVKATPVSIAALNTAAAAFATGAKLDGVFTVTYTNSSVYGAKTNHCAIYLQNASGVQTLNAEQNADGLPTQQISCPLNTPGLNSGSLVKPADTFARGSITVSNQVLGNGAESSVPY